MNQVDNDIVVVPEVMSEATEAASPATTPRLHQKLWHWFQNTPERALTEAYQAALKIQAIEQEYFSGQPILPHPDQSNQEVFSFFEDDLNRYLSVIKVRLAEFRLGRFILKQSDARSIQQLTAIDTVLNRYVLRSLTTSSSPKLQISTPLNLGNSITQPVKQPQSQVMDKSGVLPRSLGNTLNRIRTDLQPGAEQQVMEKFWLSRGRTRVAIRCLLLLILVPFLVQVLSKPLIFSPLVERLHPLKQTPLFLNSEIQEQTLHKLQQFKEQLEFQGLLGKAPELSPEAMTAQIQTQADHLSEESQREGQSVIANLFADTTAIGAFAVVVMIQKRQIIVLKAFLDDLVYGLSDSAKAFLIILFTDAFVGFHSPHGWEVILEGTAKHFGLAPNRDLIFLFIATVPVFLDTIFKYWVFRYLSRSSPSAVATLREMDD